MYTANLHQNKNQTHFEHVTLFFEVDHRNLLINLVFKTIYKSTKDKDLISILL